jgi:endonuclease/exonuclease/phosphatase family metal-dependent hydrolase
MLPERIAVLLSLVLLCLGTSAAADEAQAGRRQTALPSDCRRSAAVRILSINLRHGEGADGGSNLEAVAALVETVKPDVVAVQEVDRGVARSDRRDLPALLSEATGMHAAFAPTIRSYQGGEYGLLLLSRRPFEELGRHALPHRSGKEARIIQEARITLESGPTILIFHTHLGYAAGEALRLEQIRRLRERFHGHRYDAIFLVGDLNVGAVSRGHELLRAEYRDTASEDAGGTYPAEDPRIQLDHILFQSRLPAAVRRFRVVEEPRVSDHRPIWAEVALCISPAGEE